MVPLLGSWFLDLCKVSAPKLMILSPSFMVPSPKIKVSPPGHRASSKDSWLLHYVMVLSNGSLAMVHIHVPSLRLRFPPLRFLSQRFVPSPMDRIP